jgi:hypothetical protein
MDKDVPIKKIDDKLLLGSKAHFIPIDEEKREGKTIKKKLRPGNMPDLALGLFKVGCPLKVYSNRRTYYISGEAIQTPPPMDKRAALINLVKRHGLEKEAAQNLLKAADERKTARVWVKYAGGFPFPNMDVTSYDPSINMDVQTPTTMTTTDIPSGITLDKETIAAAEKASKLGKKDFFDTAVMTGMAKVKNLEDQISEYVSDIMRGMDRLGRVLFMYYWRADEFTDMYGQDDVVELEDSLRDTFQSLGDLVLFLKRRNVADPEEEIEA